VENEELRRLRQAHDALLRMFVEEQRSRLQLERDLIEAQARLEALRSLRSSEHRQQAPQHLPQRNPQAQALGMFPSTPLMPVMPATLENAMRRMDAFICNCAPGRHEAMSGTIDIQGDDTL
jgi:hypothetical protein